MDEGNYSIIPVDTKPSYASGGPLKMAGFNITHQNLVHVEHCPKLNQFSSQHDTTDILVF